MCCVHNISVTVTEIKEIFHSYLQVIFGGLFVFLDLEVCLIDNIKQCFCQKLLADFAFSCNQSDSFQCPQVG